MDEGTEEMINNMDILDLGYVVLFIIGILILLFIVALLDGFFNKPIEVFINMIRDSARNIISSIQKSGLIKPPKPPKFSKDKSIGDWTEEESLEYRDWIERYTKVIENKKY